MLAPFAADLTAAGDELLARITPELLETVTALVPDEWLDDEPGFDSAQAVRAAYVEHLLARARGPRTWLTRTEPKTQRPGPGSGRRVLAGRARMSRDVYEYAVIRVVPRVERGELINAGVLLYCQPRGYLCARVELDPHRLHALDPTADIDGVRQALGTYELRLRRGVGAAGRGVAGRQIPLADRATQHDRPGRPGPRRAHHRPRGGAGPPVRQARPRVTSEPVTGRGGLPRRAGCRR